MLDSRAYDAYGRELAVRTPMRVGTMATDPFGFNAKSGYTLDRELGAYLCQNRTYDPSAARWVERDPIEPFMRVWAQGPEEGFSPVDVRREEGCAPFGYGKRKGAQGHTVAKLRFNGNISEAAGAVGRLQYRRSSVGQQITERGYGKQPETAAQLAVQTDFQGASAGWSLLTTGEKALWTQAAKLESRRDPVTLRVYSITNRAYYIGLASNFLRINGPAASIPTAPPVVRFAGDTVAISATSSGGSAVWTADKANAAGVKTQLMAQRLLSKNRAPVADGYVSKAILAFDSGGGSISLALGPGVWSLAYRFVNAPTGEERPIVPLGTFVLGLAVVQGGAPDEPDERQAA